MTATKPPQPQQPLTAPSLDLPWMQALIAAGADLAGQDGDDLSLSGQASNAVHYIRCGDVPHHKDSCDDFFAAVSKARKLVATGARRIVFLTTQDAATGPLQHSLLSFSRNAGRAQLERPTEFAVVPVKRKLTD